MVTPHPTRSSVAGFTMMEMVCAFAVLSVLLSIGFLGTAGKLGQVRRSYHETLALQAASGRLEQLQVDRRPLKPETTDFLLPPTARTVLHDAVATQTVQQLEVGLFRVEATVTWQPGARTPPVAVTLKTLVVREQLP